MRDVVIIDYGAGNVKSVEFALRRLGAEPTRTSDGDRIAQASHVIFPGVGHAAYAMEHIRKYGLDRLIPDLNVPVLGICLGMQLMCAHTEEGDVAGLGIFDTQVRRFRGEEKVPHTGWNQVIIRPDKGVLRNEKDEYYYFVHSYYAALCDDTAAQWEYIQPFSAMLVKDRFWGCQFHPEKSGAAGERLLMEFLNR